MKGARAATKAMLTTKRKRMKGKRVSLPYGPYSSPNPSKVLVIFCNKIQISKRYVFRVNKHI